MDRKTAYQEGSRVVRELLSGLAEGDLLLPCPQCPGWSLRDVVAHHVHVFSERIKGWPEAFLADGAAARNDPDPEVRRAAARRRDEWIEQGVEAFRTEPFATVLSAWNRAMEQAGDDTWMLVTDLAVHLGDIEEALGLDSSRERDFVATALSIYGMRLTDFLRGKGLDTVALVGYRPDFKGGDAESPHQIRGTVYELLRTVVSRRSRAEADQTLDWGSTPEATRQAFTVYGWLDDDSGATLSLP